MQLAATIAPISAPAVIAPGTVLGTGVVKLIPAGGTVPNTPRRVDITAGRTLMSGIRDIQIAAQDMIAHTWTPEGTTGWGLVGFVRNGDAYDAVELLSPKFTDATPPTRLWAPWDIAAFTPSDDLVAVWQISPYGGDANLGQPNSMFPGAPLTPPT